MTKKCFLGLVGLICALAVLPGCGGSSSSGTPAISSNPPVSTNTPQGSNPPASPNTPQGKIELIAGNIGGSGYIDDVGGSARLVAPAGVAVDESGNVYFTEYALGTVRKISPLGAVTTLAGAPGRGGHADGQGGAASFSGPNGIAVDRRGNVFVADSGNRIIRKINSDGFVSTFAGRWEETPNPGYPPSPVDGNSSDARFQSLWGLAVDTADNLFAVDGNFIRKITPNAVVTTYVEITDGSKPVSLSVDSSGNLLVIARRENFCVQRSCQYVYVVLKIAVDRTITKLAGMGGLGTKDGLVSSAEFGTLSGIAVDKAGNVFVADAPNVVDARTFQFSQNRSIRKISASGVVTTWAGNPSGEGSIIDGVAQSARFAQPGVIAFDKAGNLYVVDDYVLRKITPDAQVSTLAGAAAEAGHRDGLGAAARFEELREIAVDSLGNILVSDGQVLRKINPVGAVTTIAGIRGAVGSVDGNVTTATFSRLGAVTTDEAGNIFVIDGHAVRRISARGTVTTLAGSVTFEGSPKDGTGPEAVFVWPTGLVSHPSGDLYLSDDGGIRKISPSGVVTTLPETLPVTSFSVDGAGNLYLITPIESTGTAIRRIAPTGEVREFSVDLNFTNCGAQQALRKTTEIDVLYFTCNRYGAANNYLSASLYRLSPSGVLTEVVKSSGLSGVQLGGLPKASTGFLRGIVALNAKSFAFISANGVLKLTPP